MRSGRQQLQSRTTAASKKKSRSAVWLALHGWFALPIWALMFFVCLTGSVATVSEEIVWLAEPAARANPPSANAHKLSYEALLNRVIDQQPDAVVQSIAIPVKGIHAPQVSVGLPDGRNVTSTEPLFVGLPTNHSLSKHSGVTWTDLMNETFLVRHGGTGPHLHDHIVQRFAGHGPAPSIQRFDVGRCSLLAMVAQGFGVTIAGAATAFQPMSDVTFLPISDEAEPVIFSAVCWEDALLRTELDVYTDYARHTRFRLVPGIW